MTDEGVVEFPPTEPVDPEDAFGESLLIDAKNRRRDSITKLLLVLSLLAALVVLGPVVFGRGQSIQAGEKERAALRVQLTEQARQISVLTDEVVAIRADVDARRRTDLCVSALSGAVANASAAALAYITDPAARDPEAPPRDPQILVDIHEGLEAAMAARAAAAGACA